MYSEGNVFFYSRLQTFYIFFRKTRFSEFKEIFLMFITTSSNIAQIL